ncbi:DNA cytosine methyltransferase [Pseudomonas sp. NPDC098747]|uniref:DNA cytosine methyltransferase n=1 Tax=Pseudomonas sp. NPDC098747 TaxID=3364487 RepID=UPI00383AD82E
MQAVDIFSGAGGMSVGACQAGVDVRYAVEYDIHAASTYKNNHPDTIMLNEDIKKISIRDMPNLLPNVPIVLFGGPPCQGFSTSNQKTRNITNEKNWLFLEYLRIAEELTPEWIVFENVKGLKETEGGMFLRDIQKSFEDIGYTVSTFTLNAADYGVPQRRERLFVIGSKSRIQVLPPKKTVRKLITVDQALHDLPNLENGAAVDALPYRSKPNSAFAKAMRMNRLDCTGHLVTRNSPLIVERYMHVPQGGNWENIPENLMLNYADRSRCHTGIYHRLSHDKPSIVVGNFRKNMLIHPWQNRGLSVREAARLQSFPDEYCFSGSIGFQQQQVGNAVPPLLAKAVFESILNCI